MACSRYAQSLLAAAALALPADAGPGREAWLGAAPVPDRVLAPVVPEPLPLALLAAGLALGLARGGRVRRPVRRRRG
jgi:hypothetical protein